ncbi:aminopeptidase [Calderihabitans maritimus]|uniref:Leucyl aminopeptidase n=1 Tax=Calderihabitans maritimus TaxID=1246530 RepID=A0A1Z5HNA4_9FIRM|nr:aminopeptidase [Calderihabitans maritimus]GAW90867.1 leucyl aminopeptidase [Calderihabitans maritimus]
MDQLRKAAEITLRDCMGVREGEKVLIVIDEVTRSIGLKLFERAKELRTEAMLVEMVSRKTHGEEPPVAVAEAMKRVQVVVAATSKSLSHTQARQEANRAGARIASMPGITPDIMARTLNADYREIERASLKFASYLTQASTARITTAAGTDLVIGLEGREGKPDTGIYHEPGSFGNLPAGEAYIAPVEGTARGKLVVDGSMAGIGRLSQPLEMRVEEGKVVEVKGGPEAELLRQMLEMHGEPAYNIAELGLGLNGRAILSGVVLEDEKVLGTVHVALGDNSTIGGRVQVPSHLDGVILKPTVELDGEIILREGKFVL